MKLESENIQGVLDRADRLHTQAEVEKALDRMAADITQVMADQDPLLLCVMTGGLIACSELFTRLKFPVQLDYLHATRYQGTRGGNELKWITRPSKPLKGRSVLVVDDILDVEGSAETLGKSAGKDEKAGKVTYPGVHGLEAARQRAKELTEEAIQLVAPYKDASRQLDCLAHRITHRRS